MNSSPKFSLNGTDIFKSLRGMLVTVVAVAGTAVLAAVSEHYLAWDYNFCVGTFCLDLKMVAIPLIGTAVELGRRFLSNYK